jgi:hypothetical protein
MAVNWHQRQMKHPARTPSARILRGSHVWACGLLVMLAFLLEPREARAQYSCDEACAAVLLLAASGMVVVASADTYYTVRAYESHTSPQVGRNAIYWTSWQAGLLDAFATGILTTGRIGKGDSDLGMGLLAFGTWPLSLTANGMWHAFPDSPASRGWAVGMVTVSDVVLLSYDALLLGKGQRPYDGLAFAEAFLGTLQLSFGLVTAFRADPEDQAAVWSMTAVPATMATYGILNLALPEAKSKPYGRRAQPLGAFASLPHLGFAQVRGGLMMQAVGAF